jgi:hypothetical protein
MTTNSIENTTGELIPAEDRRPGRPKNSHSRLTIDRLLNSIELTAGASFALLIAQGYHDAILSGDRRLRLEYERMLLAKLVADKVDIAVTESEDSIQAKKIAFQEAVRRFAAIAQQTADSAEVNKLQ